MSGVSGNYKQLRLDQVAEVAERCAQAWKHPDIPRRQYELAVEPEIQAFKRSLPSAPFDALVHCLNELPVAFVSKQPSLLDVGAATGYYSEVLKVAGFDFRYAGIDFSESFRQMAQAIYPGILFNVGDARRLPYADDSFDVVLHGACIMHVYPDHTDAIAEAVRVARDYIIFHRTPVTDGPTSYWQKDAYDIPCLEIHFNETELMAEFTRCGLELMHTVEVFKGSDYGHKTFLLSKAHQPEPYASVKSV